MKKTQMQIMQEAINKLNAMSDDDFLSALIKAGVADQRQPAERASKYSTEKSKNKRV
ncbi:hypothetical protein HGO23_06145 [Xenorhabdus budapestensis]|uniref:Transposase n=1 Tax=Xenorhabdus budapestensis TaxID=290110 RepID=A0ABX7VLW2_XENBU|nr:hypothetical protein [Xenorhabdus budapestensis]QTL40921.1 hypothetical protein HGO23_06145 [Xenorhabdus budapestensis]